MDGFNVSHKFWLPLLALFTGARMEEMCQLRANQVIQVDGVWCLKIAQDYPDQSVKTAEDRIVPLHPFLILNGSMTDGAIMPPEISEHSKRPAGLMLPKIQRCIIHSGTMW